MVDQLSSGTSYTFTVVAENHIGDSVPSAPSNAVTPSDPITPESTAMTVKALKSTKKLKKDKNKKVVRSVSVTSVGKEAKTSIKKVKAQCYLKGKKLKGKKLKRACTIKKTVTNSNAKVWIMPKCTKKLEAHVRIIGQATGAPKEIWHRDWAIKTKPNTKCK